MLLSIEITQRPCGFCTEAVRRLYSGCVILGPVQSRRQTLRRWCIHRAVVHRNHTAPMRLLYRGRAEIVQWLCDPRVYLGICVPKVYNHSFLIEMALQTWKNKIQHKTETPADSNTDTKKAAIRPWCGHREIASR